MNNLDIVTNIYKYISDPACIVSSAFSIVDFNHQFEKIIYKASSREGDANLRNILPKKILQKIKIHLYDSTPGSCLALRNISIKIFNDNEKVVDLHLTTIAENNDSFLLLFKDRDGDAFSEKMSSGAYKMAILGMLAGGVSHDINNKLSVILGYSGLAKKRAEGNEKLEADINAITEAAYEATNLVQSLVKYCRSKDGEKRLIKLGILAKEVMRFAEYVLPSSINVILRIDKQCGYVVTDPVAINDLFNLLISECLHVLKNGGAFIVDIGVQKQNDLSSEKLIKLEFDYQVVHNQRSSENSATLIVRPDTLKLVDILTSKLGCWRYVDTDTLDNSVKLKFLFDEHPGEQADHLKVESVQDVSGKEKILLVEDEVMLARLLKRALQRSGYTVTLASNGDEGYRQWQITSGAYDLVVTDMTMPGLSGTELAKKILKIDPAAKIILCTGFSDEVDEESALEVGIMEFLCKPVSNSVLMASIRRCLDSKSKQ